ncbi:MAG: septum formation initiator family protein [Gemmatimonadaceae bacterium]|nr:septum formation initiator family protein [Gemmatimonadaceae bacterium]
MASKRGSSRDKPGRVWLRRLAWGAGVLGVLAYAVEGGEYGTSDLLTQREQKAALEDSLDAVKAEVDSLEQELKVVNTDPVRLERMAREKWGMVKGDKELLYWTVTDAKKAAADSVKAAAADTTER